MKLCYWTNYPSHYQAVFFQALRSSGVDLCVVYFAAYDHYRRKLGWEEPQKLEPWELRAVSVRQVRELLPDFHERIQVCTGFYGWSYWQLVFYCVCNKLKWCACTEGSRGGLLTWPLRIFFARLVERFGLGVFAMGTTACEQFMRWGMSRAKVAWHSHSTPKIELKDGVTDHTEEVSFVFCGALVKRKAVDVLLKAFVRVHAECPGAQLRLVGDGKLRGWCERYVAKQWGAGKVKCSVFSVQCSDHTACRVGMENDPQRKRFTSDNLQLTEQKRRSSASKKGMPVVMVGAVAPETVSAELLQSSVLVLPSRYDAWGMVLAEGAELGLALIGSDRCGAAVDLIEEGISGYRVRAGSVEELAEAMLRYARDPESAVRHGKRAQELVRKTYPEARTENMVRVLGKWVGGSAC